jgi:hypothetical protein
MGIPLYNIPDIRRFYGLPDPYGSSKVRYSPCVIGRLPGWFVDRLVDSPSISWCQWKIGWLVGWLAAWLVGGVVLHLH